MAYNKKTMLKRGTWKVRCAPCTSSCHFMRSENIYSGMNALELESVKISTNQTPNTMHFQANWAGRSLLLRIVWARRHVMITSENHSCHISVTNLLLIVLRHDSHSAFAQFWWFQPLWRRSHPADWASGTKSGGHCFSASCAESRYKSSASLDVEFRYFTSLLPLRQVLTLRQRE